MTSSGEAAEKDFSFPFERPYPEQRALMKCIYDVIESSKIGILESPTGTGKSLSIICASMSWLCEEERRLVDGLRQAQSDACRPVAEDDDDWLQAFVSRGASGTGPAGPAIDPGAALAAYEILLKRIRSDVGNGFRQIYPGGSRGALVPQDSTPDDGDGQFALDEYDSDSESGPTAMEKGKPRPTGNRSQGCDDEPESLDDFRFPKIIYCSRTHSQISQFVREVKKTAFSGCRCVVLGSRKQLCINDEVRAASVDSLMSEICLEKQSASGDASQPIHPIQSKNEENSSKRRRISVVSTKGRCQFHKVKIENAFAEHILSQAYDIEQLAELGRSRQACPYYASRQAVKNAQLVCLPYNMLVHKSLRESLGISLNGNIVIIDEAHNLNEAVNGVYSAEVSYSDITASINGIDMYLERYNAVLGAKNLVYINLLRTTLVGWNRVLEACFSIKIPERGNTKLPGGEIMGTNEFLFRARLDNINHLKLKRHINTTMLVRKIGGFSTRKLQGQKGQGDNPACCGDIVPMDCTGSLRRSVELLSCFINNDKDGRIVLLQPKENSDQRSCVSKSKSATNSCISCSGSSSQNDNFIKNASIRFVLLNAASQFQEVSDYARSVILVGGTMQPFSHVTSMLFPTVPKEKLHLATFGHVVSDRNVLPLVFTTGITGRQLLFKHDTRFHSSVLDELGETLLAIFRQVPGGCPCFFTSYSYMDYVLAYWKQKIFPTGSIYDKLNEVKRVVVESRDASACEERWSIYGSTISGGVGGSLFCVIGGKMSEGINFSDDLARCVVVIGNIVHAVYLNVLSLYVCKVCLIQTAGT